MLEPEPETCYICLEECDSASPCECGMKVHGKCLSEAHYHLPRNSCSICKSPITVKPYQLFPGPVAVYIRERSTNGQTCTFIYIYLFFLYLIFGWIGKLAAYIVGCPINPEWGQFWTLEHLLAASCAFAFSTCACNSILKLTSNSNE